MNQQPSSKNCFVCGVENPIGLHIRFFETDAAPVEVNADVVVPAQYQSYPGVVHGGIVATMLDEVTSRTIFRGDPPRIVVTANLSIRYRKPVPVETPLRLSGRVVQDKGKIIKVAGEVIGPDGTVLAEAEAVVVEVDPSFFGDFSLDAQGWKVYPREYENDPVEGIPPGGGA
jgi:acyl-coenzyme A thioesterase PaaI-like protein